MNPEQEKESLEFISQVLGSTVASFDDLKSGAILCDFFNKLKPGTIKKINRQRMPFFQMENIGSYLEACRSIGIESQYLFVTVDLFEAKNLAIVALNILAVKRHFGYGFEKSSGSAGTVFDRYQ
uniref:Calponin-homology (CH) domain-containing protein n=1 Tax=Arcella intermedia TaxID=1963864 RepID=A0A6B2LRX6_9EUKA